MIEVKIHCNSFVNDDVLFAVAEHNSLRVPFGIDSIRGYFTLLYAIYPTSMDGIGWHIDPANTFNITKDQTPCLTLIFK